MCRPAGTFSSEIAEMLDLYLRTAAHCDAREDRTQARGMQGIRADNWRNQRFGFEDRTAAREASGLDRTVLVSRPNADVSVSVEEAPGSVTESS